MKQIRILIFLLCFFSAAYAQSGLRIIYIIHGDANYLFHDKDGRALDADSEILAKCISSAENLKNGEVFIFHQKPARDFLFFSGDDGEFFYYRNGLKIYEQTYSRKNSPAFKPEAGLLKIYSGSLSIHLKNILIYYGHEIPRKNTAGYHYSDPDEEFGVQVFIEGLEQFLTSGPRTKFDLVVLSTCRNGNYETARVLSPYADYLVASPSDIHLSYMNPESLINFPDSDNIDGKILALSFAESAFNILSQSVITEVSISVYDLEKILLDWKRNPEDKVITFYRPALFGRKLSFKQK